MKPLLILTVGLGLATLAGAQAKQDATPHMLSRGLSNKGAPARMPVMNTVQGLGSTTIDIDISNTQSWDALSDSSNTVLQVPIPAGSLVTGVGWDVNLTTVGLSWLSEAVFYFDGADQDLSGLFLTPGFLDGFPGTGAYFSPVIDLTDNGIPDIPILADGILYIELFESFDDVADAVDADWTPTSTLTIVYGDPPPPRCPLWIEDFEGAWPPAGWTVVDNLGGGRVWDLNTFFGDANTTTGGGQCADVNSDFYGSGTTLDTELWTDPFALPANPVQLEFDMDYNDLGDNDFAALDISTDGGATWAGLVLYDGIDTIGHQVVDLSAYASMTVTLRFHYVSGWDWWWRVDNVGFYTKATAAHRTAGTNPDSYVANAPVLGGTFDVTLDVGSTGHTMGAVVGFRTPLNLLLSGGQTLLVNIADPETELLGAVLSAGPVVVISNAVPADCALDSFDLSTQGIHIGGVTPFLLSNAWDLRVGY